jgi:hypothetical protein
LGFVVESLEKERRGLGKEKELSKRSKRKGNRVKG